MEVHHDAVGGILVTHDGRKLSTWFGVLGVLFLACGVHDELWGRGDRAVGFVGSAITLLGIALLMFERCRFAFDARTRSLEWSRRWAWWHRSGSIPFARIAAVTVERPLGDEGVPSRRILLRIDGAKGLPMTAGYECDADDRIPALAERIRGLVGLNSAPSRNSVA